MKKRARIYKMKSGKIRALKAKFKRKHGYKLDLANPRTFSEKIQWIKVFGELERFSRYVDKYEVRKYVKEKIGKQYLIPLIGVYESVEQINWDVLPNSFAMKANHGAGWNIIVKDKTKVNWEVKKKKMRKWLQSSYYRKTGESNYRKIKPKVVIEKFLNDPSGDLKDYKISCFHGEPKFIEIIGDRFKDIKCDLYDLDWNKFPVSYEYKNFKESIPKPTNLDKLLSIARKLSADFAFVRVDLYYTNDKIYFGELTFTPGNGFGPFKPRYFDEFFGQFLDIKRYV